MDIKEKTLDLLGGSDDFLSGEQIAARLNISRNAVWKSVSELRTEGYIIDAVPNRGYRISDKNTKLCRAEMQKFSGNADVILLESTDSTNTQAKRLADDGAKEGTLVVSENQTGGRGRLGRSFYSPDGGIYMSIVLRPRFSPRTALLSTTAAAVAVAESLEKFAGGNFLIKWVNDIYSGGRKVSGILTEGAFNAEAGALDYAVLGIGINLNLPIGGFPDEISETAGYVFEQKVNSRTKSEIIGEIVKSFFGYYRANDLKKHIDKYRSRSYLDGKTVEYTKDGILHTAVVIGIDGDAHLILKEGTKTVILSAGEVSVKIVK